MENFELYNPVKVIFGKGEISKIKENLSPGARVMMTFGGGSIKTNGVYDQVKSALEDFDHIEFGGIEANPDYDTLVKAVEMARKKNIDFILAVGGGSVIDGSKFIAAAINYKGDNLWDIPAGIAKIDSAVDLGVVLTLPATGSEMNSGSVISWRAMGEKRAFGSPHTFPKFSVLDPTVMASLPERQLKNGVVDAFVHVLEQYLTYPSNAHLQDRMAESILSTLIEVGPKVIKDPSNYELASEMMWNATMALNGLISRGVPVDWATHMIGHELTALFGIDHGQSLAIIGPNLYSELLDSKMAKLAQYGRRVWGLDGTDPEVAKMAIEKTREFYIELGIKLKISDYTDSAAVAPQKIHDKFQERNWFKLGDRGLVTPDVAKKIVELSL